jgi:hypothetical protein
MLIAERTLVKPVFALLVPLGGIAYVTLACHVGFQAINCTCLGMAFNCQNQK